MGRLTTWLVCLLLLGADCSTKRNPGDLLAPGEIGTIVVDARFIVGERIPDIWLRTTQSPNVPYNSEAASLDMAEVWVFVSNGDTLRYFDHSGRYLAAASAGSPPPSSVVLPNTTYRLRIVAPDGRVVTAETTTPNDFHVRDWLLLDDPSLTVRRRLATRADFPTYPDSVYYVDSNQLVYQDGLLEARFDRGGALAFQVGLFSLDLDSPYVIDADFLSAEDLASLERSTASPPFDAAENAIRLPWFAIFFAGRYDVKIYSVDRNWYDLARSTAFDNGVNSGFGGTAGDAFERPIFHINGGIGLFGSAAMDEIGFNILPKP